MSIDTPTILRHMFLGPQTVSINSDMEYPSLRNENISNLSNDARMSNAQRSSQSQPYSSVNCAVRTSAQSTSNNRFSIFKAGTENKTNFGETLLKTFTSKKPKQNNWNEKKNKAEEQAEPTDKVKTKIVSLWNNMRYVWPNQITKTNFNYDSAIWILGKPYHKKNYEDSDRVGHGSRTTSMEQFKRDFESRLWFTYRREFPPLQGNGGERLVSSDCGWGCMLRSGQMLLAQGLVSHFLGRDWRWTDPAQPEALQILHRTVVRWFGDHLCLQSPFSIHQLVALGEAAIGKKVGDWYGPASITLVLKLALEKAHENHPLLQDICLYIAQDCTIYKEDLMELCTRPAPKPCSQPTESCQSARASAPPQQLASSFIYVPDSASGYYSTDLSGSFLCVGPESTPQSAPPHSAAGPRVSPGLTRSFSVPASTSTETAEYQPFRSVIILVPVRLGGEKLNHLYIPLVKDFLAMDNTIGIIGGRPKHSLYFVGWQDDSLIYLDPHCCQPTTDVCSPDFPLASFHCPHPRKLDFSRMDPSCTLGFYCRTRQDLDNFLLLASQQLATSSSTNKIYPIFTVSEGRGTDYACGEVPQLDFPPESLEPMDEDDFVIIEPPQQ